MGIPRGVMVKVLNCDLEVGEFEFQSLYYVHHKYLWETIRDEMGKVLNCDLEVGEFELQSLYYVQFQTNTLGMHPFVLPAK